MPLELRLRRSANCSRDEDERAGSLDEELSPKTECSDDSVEMRSTPMRMHCAAINKPVILRPNAILAAHAPLPASLKRPCNNNNSDDCRNKMSRWTDAEQPEEKRMRLMVASHPPPLTPFYHPASVQQEQNGMKLAGHPHELLLLEAERNRLFHQWMRPANWPAPVHHPSVESAAAHHLMTSAMHYHYPHLIQQANSYNLPPPHHPFLHPAPAAASIFNLSYGRLLPHPIFHQRPTLFSPPSSVSGVKTLPPLSPVCAPSVTPPSLLGSFPSLVPVRRTPPPSDCNKEESVNRPMADASGESSPPSEKKKEKKKSKMSDVNPSPTGHHQMRMSKKEARTCLPLNDSGSDRNHPEANKSINKSGVKPPSSVLPLFLSVEALLSRDKPMETTPVEPEEEELRQPEMDEDDDDEEDIHWRARTFRDPDHHFQLDRVPSGQQSSCGGTTSGSNRNYKNMTRERRMQANARERTRVHTISSAFEALRRAVPSFSHGQRLSKLSILRVASAYIAALGQLAGDDNDEDEGQRQVAADGRRQLNECVDRCTRTLMTEGQLLRRNRKRSGVAGRQANASDDEDDADD